MHTSLLVRLPYPCNSEVANTELGASVRTIAGKNLAVLPSRRTWKIWDFWTRKGLDSSAQDLIANLVVLRGMQTVAARLVRFPRGA